MASDTFTPIMYADDTTLLSILDDFNGNQITNPNSIQINAELTLSYALCVQRGYLFRNGFFSCFQCFNVNLIFSRFFPIFIFLSAASTSNSRIAITLSGHVCIVIVEFGCCHIILNRRHHERRMERGKDTIWLETERN